MGRAERYPLDQVAAALEWHEAVAIVQEIATRKLAGERVHARRATDLAMDAEGRLVLSGSGPVLQVFGEPKGARDAQDLGELRGLLQELLPETSIPPALTALADPGESSNGIATVADFSKALSFFERPNRARDLKVVAARLATTTEQSTLQERLAELTRKARSDDGRETTRLPAAMESTQPLAPPPTEPSAVDPLSPWAAAVAPAPRSDFFSESELEQAAEPAPTPKVPLQLPAWFPDAKTAAIVTAAVCFVVAAAVAGFTLVTRTLASSGPTETAAASPLESQPNSRLLVEKPSGTAKKVEQKKVTIPPTARSRESAAAAVSGRGALDTSVPPVTPAAPSALAAAQPDAPPQVLTSIPERTLSIFGAPISNDVDRTNRLTGPLFFRPSAAPESSVASWNTVYDLRDPAVEPARLLRPQLPEIPPNIVLETLGLFEFVVSMRGTVERIRLVRSPVDRQYRDIMLMPAAKAWIFQPATLYGQPVRYRLQIPIPQ